MILARGCLGKRGQLEDWLQLILAIFALLLYFFFSITDTSQADGIELIHADVAKLEARQLLLALAESDIAEDVTFATAVNNYFLEEDESLKSGLTSVSRQILSASSLDAGDKSWLLELSVSGPRRHSLTIFSPRIASVARYRQTRVEKALLILPTAHPSHALQFRLYEVRIL